MIKLNCGKLVRKYIEEMKTRRTFYINMIMIPILACFFTVFLYGCGYEPEYFSKEELSDYRSPILFLSSKEDDGKYFIMLDQQDSKVYLDYSKIWDYDSEGQTFLFSMKDDGEEKIYEYDLAGESYRCILDAADVEQAVNQPDKNDFKSIFYHFSDERISGVYGGDMFIYDMSDKKVIYREKLPEGDQGEICAWIDSQTYLYRLRFEIFEVRLDTGEMRKLTDDLAFGCVLSKDKEIGCSNGIGEEQWNGGNFSPILVWDTSDYHIKRFKEGISMGARMQISDDNKYIMFARSNVEKDYQILCIGIEDEKMCTVYETPDYIFDLLW